MLEPRLIELEPMTVAFISMEGPYEQIPKCFGMLYDYVTQNEWTPCGPPHGVYLTRPDEVPEERARWELWAPIAEEEEERGPDDLGLGVRRLDKRMMIASLHIGSYDNLKDTYQQLGQWITDHGYEMIGPPEEIYLSEPEEDEASTRTDILFPVRRA